MRMIIIAYALVSIMLFGWLTVHFEVLQSFFTALLFASPMLFAFQMACQQRKPRGNEYVYLGSVTALAISGTVFVVEQCFHEGLDREVLFRRRFAEFRDELLKEPEFKHVELSCKNIKGMRVYVEGRVADEATYHRLIQRLRIIDSNGCYDELDYPGRKREHGYVRFDLLNSPEPEPVQPETSSPQGL